MKTSTLIILMIALILISIIASNIFVTLKSPTKIFIEERKLEVK
tara:strand:+ start:152 stop:283 length:132 start_codon:yes stop_codon:yes gene_type:complete